jgi:ribosomal protein L40E
MLASVMPKMVVTQKCMECGATLGETASWCGNCYAPVNRVIQLPHSSGHVVGSPRYPRPLAPTGSTWRRQVRRAYNVAVRLALSVAAGGYLVWASLHLQARWYALSVVLVTGVMWDVWWRRRSVA